MLEHDDAKVVQPFGGSLHHLAAAATPVYFEAFLPHQVFGWP